MLNHMAVMGRLTANPVVRSTADGKSVANFTVAVDRDYASNGEKKTDFFDCTVWRSSADFAAKYFEKGTLVVVSGRGQIDSYETKSGEKRQKFFILAENVYLAGSKGSSSSGGNVVQATRVNAKQLEPESEPNFEPLEDGELVLPF